MQLGSFGNVIFEVSAKKVQTISDFTRSGNFRYASHDLMNQKPLLESLGQGLEEISFTIKLNRSVNIDILEDLIKLRNLRNNGKENLLILGEKPIGANYWVITNMSEESTLIDNKGKFISINVKLTLKEYIKKYYD